MLYALTYIAPPPFRLTGKKAPLVRGSLAHVGQAHTFQRMLEEQQGRDPEVYYKPVDAIEIKAASMLGDYPKHMVEHERDTAIAMTREYAKHVPIQNAKYEILAVEEIVYFYIGGRTYTQRMDLLVRERTTGKKKIRDWKSSSSHNANTLSGFAPSLQMQGYRWWGPQLFGDEWGGVEIGMLKAEPPYTPEVVQLQNAPQLVARFPQTVMDAEKRIEALIAEGRPWDQWPPTSDELVCVHRYGRCEGWDPCLWGKESPAGGLVQFGAASGVALGDIIKIGGGG